MGLRLGLGLGLGLALGLVLANQGLGLGLGLGCGHLAKGAHLHKTARVGEHAVGRAAVVE